MSRVQDTENEKTGIKPEKPEDTDQVEKKNSVTVQYLHSYEPKCI